MSKTSLPVDIKAEAYRMYLYDNLTVKEIAKRLDISKDTLAYWIKKDGENWTERKKELQQELMSNAEFEFMKLRRQRKLNVASDDLETTDLLIQRIKSKLKAKQTNGKLKWMSERDIAILSKALKDLTDVRHRIVGINDKNPGEDQPITGRSAMFLIGMQIQPSQNSISHSEPKTIEAQEVKKADPF